MVSASSDLMRALLGLMVRMPVILSPLYPLLNRHSPLSSLPSRTASQEVIRYCYSSFRQPRPIPVGVPLDYSPKHLKQGRCARSEFRQWPRRADQGCSGTSASRARRAQCLTTIRTPGSPPPQSRSPPAGQGLLLIVAKQIDLQGRPPRIAGSFGSARSNGFDTDGLECGKMIAYFGRGEGAASAEGQGRIAQGN